MEKDDLSLIDVKMFKKVKTYTNVVSETILSNVLAFWCLNMDEHEHRNITL